MLFYDDEYKKLAEASAQAAQDQSVLSVICLRDVEQTHKQDRLSGDAIDEIGTPLHSWNSELDVAYIRHTSGTSTGLPKPIPQSHRAAVNVPPRLDGHKDASFTTTPLYHGGISDCFRAWTSRAMIWLFPEKEVPITSSNVLRCLDCAQNLHRQSLTPTVKYFSSVPYVLQMLAADTGGLNRLREMDIVGVGGAALPQIIGDDLVNQGVNLVSRFGSAECGFLLSSHRDYVNDRAWQYLRNHTPSLLSFEKQDEDELAELVISADWPHMAKRNRKDGSFATADLFEPHATIPNAWKYHSRADSQLTLITGKKVDPAPLEDAIATSPLLSDVLIFGNGQQYLGALLFRSEASRGIVAETLIHELWPRIEKMNAEGQAHTRLAMSMLMVMPQETPGLEKSSKGTILRGQAERRYQSEIEAAYSGDSTIEINSGLGTTVEDDDVPLAVLDIIKKAANINSHIPADADLFATGVDSVACMRIRTALQKVKTQKIC